MDISFKASTIEELNKKFIDSVIAILPKAANYFTESLVDFYRAPGKHSLYIEKAAELYDKNNEVSMEALSKKMEKIFKDNVKPNSYLKIKSGIFGTKVQLDSLLENSEEAADIEAEIKTPENSHFLSNKKGQLHDLYAELFFNDETKLNFIEKSNRYEFTIKGFAEIDEAGVYVIDFEPKRNEDFKGTIYVNIEDIAIMRIDYNNVKSLRRIKLLGLSYEETVFEGTTIFAKGENDKYDLRFVEKIEGRLMGVDRPLKVIEKNKYVKGRRKQNELSLGLDIVNQQTSKYELVVLILNSWVMPILMRLRRTKKSGQVILNNTTLIFGKVTISWNPIRRFGNTLLRVKNKCQAKCQSQAIRRSPANRKAASPAT